QRRRDVDRPDHRPGDRVRLREQPDEPEDEREHPDQQPGAPAEVAEPARRRERAAQLRPPTSVVAVRGVHVTSSLTAPPDADLIPLGGGSGIASAARWAILVSSASHDAGAAL